MIYWKEILICTTCVAFGFLWGVSFVNKAYQKIIKKETEDIINDIYK